MRWSTMMTMTCTPVESGPKPVDLPDSRCLVGTPNRESRRSAGKLFLLFCKSKSEIDALNDSDRKATIRGDLLR